MVAGLQPRPGMLFRWSQMRPPTAQPPVPGQYLGVTSRIISTVIRFKIMIAALRVSRAEVPSPGLAGEATSRLSCLPRSHGGGSYYY